MILKNITSSDKELIDMTGKRILVKSGKTIELDRASFNKNSFEMIEKTDIEQNMTKVEKSTKEEINIEKEVI